MTANEFKAILKDAGVSTNYEDILNYVSSALHAHAVSLYKAGATDTADKLNDRANKVQSYLENSGYYDDVLVKSHL